MCPERLGFLCCALMMTTWPLLAAFCMAVKSVVLLHPNVGPKCFSHSKRLLALSSLTVSA